MDNAMPPDPKRDDIFDINQQPGAHVPAPTPGSPPPRSALILGAIGLLVGLAVGGLVGTFVLGGGARGGSADGDAAIACGYVARVSEELDTSMFDLDDPVVWRLQAIGPLALAAAKADARYEEFGEQGNDLYAAVARFDAELLESSLQAMAESCDTF